MTSAPAVAVVVGSCQHGVVRHALTVASATGSAIVRLIGPPASTLDEYVPDGSRPVHVHFTDRLFGTDASAGARTFGTFAGHGGRRLVVTLHDVPQPGHEARDRRRIDAYRLVGECATTLVVSSEHERSMAEACGIGGRVTVIPLPIDAPIDAPTVDLPLSRVGTPGRRVVAVLGFIYPGKGHADLVHVLAELPQDVELWAVGRPSDGHEQMAGDLLAQARRAGRRMVVTGFLDDGALASVLRSVDVAVVPAAATSASATVGTWIAAGRRPLVASNPYTAELAMAAPGLVELYEPACPGALLAALRSALAEPASTVRRRAIPPPFTTAEVAARHVRLYQRVLEAPCAP